MNSKVVVMVYLAKDPAQRPQSAAELQRRLADCSVGSWTNTDAEQSWHEYGPRCTPQPETFEVSGETMAGDGAQRRVHT